MNANKLMVSLKDNDELKGYLTAKGAGDTCHFKVEASLDDQTAEQAVFTVKDITLVKDEKTDDEEPEEEGYGEGKDGAAVMAAMSGSDGPES